MRRITRIVGVDRIVSVDPVVPDDAGRDRTVLAAGKRRPVEAQPRELIRCLARRQHAVLPPAFEHRFGDALRIALPGVVTSDEAVAGKAHVDLPRYTEFAVERGDAPHAQGLLAHDLGFRAHPVVPRAV